MFLLGKTLLRFEIASLFLLENILNIEKIIPPAKEESFNPINLLNKKKKKLKKTHKDFLWN